MTERMTHTRSGSRRGTTGPIAAVRTRPLAAPPVVRPEIVPARLDPGPPAGPEPAPDGTIDPAWGPVPSAPPPAAPRPAADQPAASRQTRPDDRRAQRAARRRRRRLAVWCAVLIAFCLAMTILIVVMAGNRTPGPGVVAGPAPVAAPPARAPVSLAALVVPPGNRSQMPGRGRP
ncbi:MAG: hypothetical protein ACRDYE_00760 [Acidimicrobiales bacterium]